MKAFRDAQDELTALHQRQTDTLKKVHQLVTQLQHAREAHEVRKIERNLAASYQELAELKGEIRVARQRRRDATPPTPAAQVLAPILNKIKKAPELEATEAELASLRARRKELVDALQPLLGSDDANSTRQVRELDNERIEIEQSIVNVRQRRNKLVASHAAKIAAAMQPLRIKTARGLLKSIQDVQTAWALMAEFDSAAMLVTLPAVNCSGLDTLEEFLKRLLDR
jgi:hypothetical protein